MSVALDADTPVSVTSDGFDVDISLPTGLNVHDGVIARDGTVVFEADGDDAHAAVQTLDDGSVRLQTVLDSPDAPTTYTYDFGDDVELIALDDGSVDVTSSVADGVTASFGTIAAPWATDADGNPVPTHYTVNGSQLTQHVDHGATDAYPITADPTFGHTYGIPTMYLNWSETKFTARNAGYAAWLCTRVPAGLSMICAGNVAILQKGANDARRDGLCAKYLISPGVLWADTWSC